MKQEHAHVSIRNFGTTYRATAADTGGAVAILEHTLEPGYVAMPMHRHRRETETTYVLDGTLTIQLGAGVIRAREGTCVVKPPGVFHTFWNAGDALARFLEVITPAGFEHYYEEVAALIPTAGPPRVDAILALSGRYELEVDMMSLYDIIERHEVQLA